MEYLIKKIFHFRYMSLLLLSVTTIALVALGIWQLDRAKQKETISEQFTHSTFKNIEEISEIKKFKLKNVYFNLLLPHHSKIASKLLCVPLPMQLYGLCVMSMIFPSYGITPS